MRVKICGITNLNDALSAIEAGASALGFVFYKKSPRYIEPKKAKEIVTHLPPFVQTVGLFVNEEAKEINTICHASGMQLAQIIDDNNATKFKNLKYKYISVIRVKTEKDLEQINNKFVLVDAFVETFGGEGKQINTSWFKNINTSKVILAGGLTSENIRKLSSLNFYGFDVSSGVEKTKGIKDKEKMFDFIKVANEIKK